MESRSFVVPDELDGARADQAIAHLTGLSRSFAAEILVSDGAAIAGRLAVKSDRVHSGDTLDVAWEPRREPEVVAESVAGFGVVYDDDDIVVVDKPAGVAAHPSVGWSGPTVLGALAAGGYQVAQLGPSERAGIVHRLDAGTSGLMVVAKSERAFIGLKRAFHDREVDKIYHAVVQGHPDPFSGTIDAPIGRHPRHDWKFAVTAQGKPSVTHYETLEAFPYATLLEVHLETGRTHQIRVHMAAQRHPCVGDPLYGSDPSLAERLGLHRQWLHAHRLGFVHPGTGEDVVFESPYPVDLRDALTILERD
ncbi:RluA family pseudouridine synthase [Mycetocola reblochoni]|uniref:Pseudouridine synthase n=2 Tax=Mycetocola reblochoni TaxID=331618 RepID=A0A1R4J6G9_9MICO|nr:RluA family pseudouridine synthase [Mycetocola reblochoni]RLP69616.1 RluA family pseudouridine synthase [Mycetocola reblochoni]SJN27658.1 Ribosomal large subunit pseudouridine synthase D [Mycetocola reblochoni REB411]